MINILTDNESTRQLNEAVLASVKTVLTDKSVSLRIMHVAVTSYGKIESRRHEDMRDCLSLVYYQKSNSVEGIVPRYQLVVDDRLRQKLASAFSRAVKIVSEDILKGNC